MCMCCDRRPQLTFADYVPPKREKPEDIPVAPARKHRTVNTIDDTTTSTLWPSAHGLLASMRACRLVLFLKRMVADKSCLFVPSLTSFAPESGLVRRQHFQSVSCGTLELGGVALSVSPSFRGRTHRRQCRRRYRRWRQGPGLRRPCHTPASARPGAPQTAAALLKLVGSHICPPLTLLSVVCWAIPPRL